MTPKGTLLKYTSVAKFSNVALPKLFFGSNHLFRLNQLIKNEPLTVLSNLTNALFQIAWADTKTIGCGYTMFVDKGWSKKIIFCNYGPA